MLHDEQAAGTPVEPSAQERPATEPQCAGVYLVRQRRTRLPARFFPPILLALASAGFLAYRTATPDHPGPRPPGSRSVEAPLLASAAGPSAESRSAPNTKSTPKQAVDPAPKQAGEPEPKRKPKDVWDDIQREAERKKAEIDELQREKDEAAKRAPRQVPPPPRRLAPPRFVQADLEQLMKEARERQRRHLEEMFRAQREFHQRFFEQMDQMNARGPQPGFPNPPFLPPAFMAEPWEDRPPPPPRPDGNARRFGGELNRPGFHMIWEYRIETSGPEPIFPPGAGG